MAQFKYDGDLEGLNSNHFNFISKVLTEMGFESDTVEVSAVGALGDNYQATVKRLTIKDFKMIAKIAPALPALRMQMQTESVFSNEAIAYELLLPKFDELQSSVGMENRLKHAKCYGISREVPNEIILLEDLKTLGYDTLNRMQPLSDECIRLVLKDFAIFHALSFVLKRNEPELYKHLCANLRNIMAQVNEAYVIAMELAERQMHDILDNEEFKEKIKGFMVTEFLKFPQLEKEDAEAGKTVVIQGDAWTNNIMFKIENEKPTSCIMIDYQMSRQANLLTDLNYLIFNCSDYETRTKNYHSWLNFYYKELSKVLDLYNINSEDVYPRETLESDMKRYAKIALATGLLFNGMVIRESDEVVDYKKEMENNADLSMEDLMERATSIKLADKSVLRMRERLNGLIQSFIDLGYL